MLHNHTEIQQEQHLNSEDSWQAECQNYERRDEVVSTQARAVILRIYQIQR